MSSEAPEVAAELNVSHIMESTFQKSICNILKRDFTQDFVYGDGVNVASRLETITDPGGITDAYGQRRY